MLLSEMIKTIQGLKTECSKDTDILKKTHAEMKMELKNSET